MNILIYHLVYGAVSFKILVSVDSIFRLSVLLITQFSLLLWDSFRFWQKFDSVRGLILILFIQIFMYVN